MQFPQFLSSNLLPFLMARYCENVSKYQTSDKTESQFSLLCKIRDTEKRIIALYAKSTNRKITEISPEMARRIFEILDLPVID